MGHKRLPLGTEERRGNDHGREKGFLGQIAGQYCVDCCNCGARGVRFFGNAFNSATKEKEVRLKTVVAIGVLSQDPNKSTPFLRDWAIDVVDSYSGIPFSAKARDELRRTALPSKDAERLLDMMSKSLSGTNGGVFFESSVPNFKVFLNDDDITKYVPNISSRRPIVAPVGSGKIRVEFDGGKFETLFPVMKDHLKDSRSANWYICGKASAH